MPCGVARIPGPEEWILHKKCTRCGKTKPWAKFPPRAYWPDGSVRRIAAHCSACDAEMTRVRQLKWREEGSEQWKRLEAGRREWRRRKRHAISADRATARNSHRLPIEPIREFIERQTRKGVEIREIAEVCEIPERAIDRILHENKHVSLRLADTIATRLGVHLYDLYLELAEEAA